MLMSSCLLWMRGGAAHQASGLLIGQSVQSDGVDVMTALNDLMQRSSFHTIRSKCLTNNKGGDYRIVASLQMPLVTPSDLTG
jgi:hypothetical protein